MTVKEEIGDWVIAGERGMWMIERMMRVEGEICGRGLEGDGYAGSWGEKGRVGERHRGLRGEAGSRTGTATDHGNHQRGSVRSTYRAPRTRTGCSSRSNPAYARAPGRQDRGRPDRGSDTGRSGAI